MIIENIGNLMGAEPAAQHEGINPGIIPTVMRRYANNRRDSSYKFKAANKYASAPAIDLLAELQSAVGYISEPKPISVSSPATKLHRAATAEYDLQPLDEDLGTGEADDLLADILAESVLAVPLRTM